MSQSTSPRLAILIDADNTPAKAIPNIMEEITKYGTAHVRRIYGDWSNNQLSGWRDVLLDHSIQAVQQFAYTTGKNATDIAMIIDAMDLMYTGRFDGFCLVSSDSDFTPLAARIREQALTVFGFGQKKTPKPFVETCDKFIYLELLDPQNIDSSSVKPVTDPKLFHYFKTAIDAICDDNGWASLGGVGSQLNKQAPDFDSRTWGHSKLSDLANAIPKFETKHTNNQVRVRLKPSIKKTTKKAAKKATKNAPRS